MPLNWRPAAEGNVTRCLERDSLRTRRLYCQGPNAGMLWQVCSSSLFLCVLWASYDHLVRLVLGSLQLRQLASRKTGEGYAPNLVERLQQELAPPAKQRSRWFSLDFQPLVAFPARRRCSSLQACATAWNASWMCRKMGKPLSGRAFKGSPNKTSCTGPHFDRKQQLYIQRICHVLLMLSCNTSMALSGAPANGAVRLGVCVCVCVCVCVVASCATV